MVLCFGFFMVVFSCAHAQTPTATITNTPVPSCSGSLGISKNKYSPSTDTTQLILNIFLCAPGACSLKVYNTAGEHITTLLDVPDQDMGSAAVTWDGKNDKQTTVASGIYLITLKEPLGIHYGRILIVR
jgi:hypothetical protein